MGPKYKFLIYWDPGKEDIHRVVQLLHGMPERVETRFCPTISSLECELRRPGLGLYHVVCVVNSKEELRELVHRAHLLDGHKLFMLIHDGGPEELSLAHSLRPRFLTWGAGAPRQIELVLRKVLGRKPQPDFSAPLN